MRSTTEPQCTLQPASVSDSHFLWQNQAIMPERRVIGYYGLRNEQQDEVAGRTSGALLWASMNISRLDGV